LRHPAHNKKPNVYSKQQYAEYATRPATGCEATSVEMAMRSDSSAAASTNQPAVQATRNRPDTARANCHSSSASGGIDST